MVNNWFYNASFRLLPGRCLLCLGTTGIRADICPDCYRELPWLWQSCQRCALPLPQDSLCGQCLQAPPRFDDCLAAWEYGFPIAQLISRFKYQGRQLDGQILARLALGHLRARQGSDGTAPDWLTPVPMPWRRLWRRGFNQADRLATQWGRALGIPVFRGLYRQTANPTQQGLKARERHRNLKTAFAVRHPERIAGKHIAIVDDVVTTGATANSVAAILREAGARRVSVWCLARTP